MPGRCLLAQPEDVLLELGDATRLRVFVSLLEKRKNVTQLVTELGLAQPRVSYHLKKLKAAGLAAEEREGRWIWYGANWDVDDPHVVELLKLVARWSGAADEKAIRRQVDCREIRKGSGRPASECGGRGKKATIRQVARVLSAKIDSREIDDEGRPVVERPKKRRDDMEDFLL
jgi:DNA-binding transcriptional ArsR family regulator